MSDLLDTHILLWWLATDSRLSPAALATITKPQNRIFISAANVWQISIKSQLGKLKIEESIPLLLPNEGFEELSITGLHAQEAANLPRHHKDPFDRTLIAQARLERLTLISTDNNIADYDVDLFKA